MPKISPTDKLFDELIPDSAEYWQAIENIDFEPNPKKSFWAYIKEFFASPIQDAIAETESNVFTPVNPNDFRAFLQDLYPDMIFLFEWDKIRIKNKGGRYRDVFLVLESNSWGIASEQEHKALLAQVSCAVQSIQEQQFNSVQNRIR